MAAFPPSSPPTLPFPPLPRPPLLCILSGKGKHPMDINKAQVSSCCETKHLPLSSGWARQPSRKDRFPRASQSITEHLKDAIHVGYGLAFCVFNISEYV